MIIRPSTTVKAELAKPATQTDVEVIERAHSVTNVDAGIGNEPYRWAPRTALTAHASAICR
jgi:hypothetical protein